MAFQNSSSILVALGAATLLLLPACDSAVETDDTGGTTGGSSTSGPPATSSTTVPATSSTSTDPGTTTVSPGSSSTGEEETTSSTTDASSSTGEPTDCVDEDIGDAVGEEVASGTNDGQGDDFALRYCDGGVSSSTSATTVGPDDTGGGEATTVDPDDGGGGGATTGMGGGTTGDSGDSGDDYVVSWTPPGSGPFVIDTFGSGIDTVLSVVAPECGASRGDCNDDCEGFESGLIYEATEGETVYIVIEGYSGRQGTFVLNIAEGDALECGGFDTDGPMTSSTSAGTSVGTTFP